MKKILLIVRKLFRLFHISFQLKKKSQRHRNEKIFMNNIQYFFNIGYLKWSSTVISYLSIYGHISFSSSFSFLILRTAKKVTPAAGIIRIKKNANPPTSMAP